MAENAEGAYTDEREPWEPRQAEDWLQADPFLRALSAAEYSIPSTEAAVFSFHAAWMRMPPVLRAQVWREREIAATLTGLLQYWRRSIPGLYSVGVGLRSTPEPRLSAVVTLEHPLTAGEWRELR